MAAVRMLVKLSGMRDGVEWPAAGEVLVCPADEASSLIGTGLAVEVVKADESEAAAVVADVETATVRRGRPRKGV